MKTIVKVLLIALIVSVLGQCKKDTNLYVTIPDDNFLNALIVRGVDKNGDGIISTGEAAEITFLNIFGRNISDLKGIEAFVNLDSLNCVYNQLTRMDITKNHKLIFLLCGENSLTSLDVSNNPALYTLACYGNSLTSIDVSNNPELISLFCNSNSLTSLDVSNNTALINLVCGDNQLTSLDLSNNTLLEEFNLASMPSLNKVCVWTMPFPPAGVTVDSTSSPNVYFTMECN